MSWEVIGHEWAERLLVGHLQRGEARHAYLFSGPPGVGRRTLALRFAQALMCPTPSAPGEPCRVCRVCAQVERGQHIDLSVIQAEREGGTLKVEQVRELQKSLSLLPYEAPYRVALLLRFHEANANAQNALLKALEEAPSRVILLLTADSPDVLLPTIVSRCEVLRLRPLAIGRLENELARRGIAPDPARLLAHLSGGRLGQALRLQEDAGLLEQRAGLLDDWQRLLSANRAERFQHVDALTRGAPDRSREAVRQAFFVWLSVWRDVLLAAASPSLPLANPDCESSIRRVAVGLTLSSARRCVCSLEQGLARLDANVNTRLLAEVVLLDWPRVAP